MVEVVGEPVTLQRFKNRKYGRYWVTFTHDSDPSLSFAGEVNTARLSRVYNSTGVNEVYRAVGWREVVGTSSGGVTYHPPHYMHCLVPLSWRYDHAERHPLVDELHIPTCKRTRVDLLGLPNDKAKLDKIKIAGGRLTICDLVLEEKTS